MINRNTLVSKDTTVSPRSSQVFSTEKPLSTMESLTPSSLLDKMVDAVLLVDANGKTEFINQSAARLLGISPYTVRGQSISSLFTVLDKDETSSITEIRDWLQTRLAIPAGSEFVRLRRRNGDTLAVDISVTPLNRVDHVITGLMLVIRNFTDIQTRMDGLLEAARYDENTHLLRRNEFERRLERVLQSMSTTDRHALLFMDLDHFKQINDTAGHQAGDKALVEVAELFRAQVRARDTLARLGGDEFGLLLEHCPLPLAIDRAIALRAAVTSNHIRIARQTFHLDVSIGIASFHSGRYDVRAVVGVADAACYAAKRRVTSNAKIFSTIMD